MSSGEYRSGVSHLCMKVIRSRSRSERQKRSKFLITLCEISIGNNWFCGSQVWKVCRKSLKRNIVIESSWISTWKIWNIIFLMMHVLYIKVLILAVSICTSFLSFSFSFGWTMSSAEAVHQLRPNAQPRHNQSWDKSISSFCELERMHNNQHRIKS